MTTNIPLQALMKVAEDTLAFEYEMGDVTRVRRHATGWRTLPSLVTCHVDYATRIETPGRAPVVTRAGDTICLPPGLTHNIIMTSPARGISRWSHTNFRILGTVDVFALLDPPHRIRGRPARQIGDINQALAELTRRPEPDLRDVIRRKALGLELLAVVAEASSLRADALQLLHGARQLTPVLTYIHRHLGDPLDRAQLARLAHLSPSRFHTVFQRALGKAPGQYVQDLRLRKAQQYLVHADLGIEEIGRQVGYPDPFHFSRLFRKRCGMSPSEYRRQARAGLIHRLTADEGPAGDDRCPPGGQSAAATTPRSS